MIDRRPPKNLQDAHDNYPYAWFCNYIETHELTPEDLAWAKHQPLYVYHDVMNRYERRLKRK